MKTFLKAIIIALVGLGVGSNWSARAEMEVSAAMQIHATADFEVPLAAQGAWVTAGSYGRCWHPVGVAVGWRPYCDGEWVWTDAGWYWESDEPWGWACYHYGCWVEDPTYGWVWVPDIEWAPAWVCWRVGGGYVGWAPLPPRHGWFGFRAGLPDPAFVFVQTDRFHERVTPSAVIVNNREIAGQTRLLSNMRQENRSIEGGAMQRVNVNTGPGLADIQRATGSKIRQVSLRDAVDRTPVPSVMSSPSRGPANREKHSAPLQQPQPMRAPGFEFRDSPRLPEEPVHRNADNPPAHDLTPPPGRSPEPGVVPRGPAAPVREGSPGGGKGRGPDKF